jgi:hypothetical protein
MRALLVGIGFAILLGCTVRAIDADPSRWVRYAFDNGNTTLSLRVPPGFRVFDPPRPPMASYDGTSQRRVLNAQYDFGSRGGFELAQFSMTGTFFRLSNPTSALPDDITAIDAAVAATRHRPTHSENESAPRLVTVGGRAWIHYEYLNSKDPRESYATLIDESTVFYLGGWYLDKIMKDPAWLESRRKLLAQVLDTVVIDDTHRAKASDTTVSP